MRFWAAASSLLACLTLGVAPACSTDFNQPLSCSVLAAQLELPSTMAPDSSTRFRLYFDTPLGARYQVDWLASRGTISATSSGSAGASGSSTGAAGSGGLAGSSGGAGEAGTAGASGAAGSGGAAGDGGAAGGGGIAGSGVSGSSGQSGKSGTSGQGGEPDGEGGEAGEGGGGGAPDVPAGTSEVEYTAPDSTGEVQVTATLTRIEGSDSDGPGSCSISGKIQVLTEDQLTGGAGGAGGAGGSGGP